MGHISTLGNLPKRNTKFAVNSRKLASYTQAISMNTKMKSQIEKSCSEWRNRGDF